jgi:hypothetical protein
MILLAVLTLLTSVLIRTHQLAIDLVLVVFVAIVVGGGFVTAAVLEYPFSGSIAVSSEAYESGPLAHVVQADP